MTLPPERELVRELTAKIESIRNRRGTVDDCAVVPLGSVDLVATVDTFAAPTHFPAGTPMRMAGRFAAAAAMSDLAAAGADPLGLLVGYGLPATMTLDEARELADGVVSAVAEFGGEVLGGDTKPRPVLELAVTALGTTAPGRSMSRTGARAGDLVLVTGPLGGAGAALGRIREGLAPSRAEPLLSPAPRLRAGKQMAAVGVRCATDLSDGLAEGAASIAVASHVRVVVEAGRVPLHSWTAGGDGLALALRAGGDYELLVTVPVGLLEEALDACKRGGTEPTIVGRVESGSGARLEGAGPERDLVRGHEHSFAGSGENG